MVQSCLLLIYALTWRTRLSATSLRQGTCLWTMSSLRRLLSRSHRFATPKVAVACWCCIRTWSRCLAPRTRSIWKQSLPLQNAMSSTWETKNHVWSWEPWHTQRTGMGSRCWLRGFFRWNRQMRSSSTRRWNSYIRRCRVTASRQLRRKDQLTTWSTTRHTRCDKDNCDWCHISLDFLFCSSLGGHNALDESVLRLSAGGRWIRIAHGSRPNGLAWISAAWQWIVWKWSWEEWWKTRRCAVLFVVFSML